MFKANRLLRRLTFLLILFLIITLVANMYYKIRYPLSYKGIIKKYSREYNVDPYLVSAIINVESNFDKNALSPKDARGLMQITPKTGEWAAAKIGIEDFTVESLYDPEINIRIGTWYLDILSKEFHNNIQLILAAYNGGSGNVSKWLQNEEYCEDGKFLKKIPFKETEQYIEKVLKNYEIYKNIYKNEFQEEIEDNEPYFLQLFHNFRNILKDYMDSILGGKLGEK